MRQLRDPHSKKPHPQRLLKSALLACLMGVPVLGGCGLSQYGLDQYECDDHPTHGLTPQEQAFRKAISHQDLEEVRRMIAGGADVNAADCRNKTPLMDAAACNNPEIVRALLDAGAAINARDNNGRTALMAALMAALKAALKADGNLEIVRALLEAGADPNVKDTGGNTALSWAAARNNPETVRALLNAGADINAKSGAYGVTALMQAAYSGNLETVRVLLAAGADINAISGCDTALMETAFHGLLPEWTWLNAGADINAESGAYGVTALMQAVNFGNLETVRALLDAGADPNTKDDGSSSLLIIAIRHNSSEESFEIFRALLAAGADPNAKDHDGRTPLSYAIAKLKYHEVVKALLDAGADPNAISGYYGRTPLNYVINELDYLDLAEVEKVELVKALLAAGADPNATEDGQSPLMYAVRTERTELAQALIDGGADLNATEDEKGHTILQLAEYDGQWRLLKALMDRDNPLDKTHSAWPEVNQPLRTGVKAPRDAAVVVSIERYPLLDDRFAVPYASIDGDGFEHFLTYSAGIPSNHLHRLQDKTATAELIEDAFDAALKEAKGGTLWFYFAGHGAASSEDRDQVILGSDVPMDERLMEKHALALKPLQQKVARSQVAQAVFVIDACNIPSGLRFAAPVDLALQESSKPVLLWSASSQGETSRLLQTTKHGIFTYAALGALRGWADGEIDGQKDGQVTSDEAQAFVKRFFKEQDIREQNPVLLSKQAQILARKAKERAPEKPVPPPASAVTPDVLWKALMMAFYPDNRWRSSPLHQDLPANPWDNSERWALLSALCDAGVNVNLKDVFENETMLHKAAAKEDLKMMTFLLALGADANAQDEDGRTPLYLFSGESESTRLLLSAGARVNARDKKGNTPLMAALTTEKAQMLLDAGTDLEAKNDEGMTALLLAAKGDDESMFRFLIDAGANPEAKDHQGRGALEVCTEECGHWGCEGIRQILKETKKR